MGNGCSTAPKRSPTLKPQKQERSTPDPNPHSQLDYSPEIRKEPENCDTAAALPLNSVSSIIATCEGYLTFVAN